MAVLTVSAQADLECELGILDLTANGGNNPATSAPWAEGDTYRFAFFTSVARTAEEPNIVVYNDWAQGLANDTTAYDIGVNEGVVWKIIGSTSAIDARDNTSTNPTVETGCAIYLLDGSTLVASDNADLWDGSIDHIIDRTEQGALFTWWPWTGTYLDGIKAPDSPGGRGALGYGDVSQGRSDVTTEWIWRTNTSDGAATLHNMYALSDPLVIINTNPDLPDVQAGSDWVTWSGEPVVLDDVVVTNNLPSALTYAWTASPSAGVVFTPNDGGDGSTSSVESPTVTITKATTNPSVVTFTLAVNNEGSGNPDEIDTMRIDVYDNSCLAADDVGTVIFDPTDFNDDCLTNLNDIAEVAFNWLVDYALTAPATLP
jgi:hypothetical protein